MTHNTEHKRLGKAVRFSAVALVAFLAIAISHPWQTVYAAAGWDLTLTRETAIPVASGTEVVYELRIQCSAVAEPSCDNGQLTLNIPDDVSGILNLAVQQPNPLIQSVTPTATGADITLISPFPAGATGYLRFEITPPNGITPDGYSWTVEATVSADNTGSMTVQSDGASTATPQLGLTKRGPRGPLDGTLLPVDQVVRYYLNPCDLALNGAGDLWLESGVLTDVLPAQAEFRGASPGGTHDGSLLGGTVTWNLTDFGGSECSNSGSYWVDVYYDEAAVGLDCSSNTGTAATVINQASVTATPYGSTTPLTANDDLPHGFACASPEGDFYKGVRTLFYSGDHNTPSLAGDYSDGEDKEIHWRMGGTNRGDVPLEFELIEPIPCLDNNQADPGDPPIYTSLDPTAAGYTPCANPAFVTEELYFKNDHFSFFKSGYDAGWRPTYVTNNGATGVFDGVPNQCPDSGQNCYMEPVGLPTGDVIAEIRLPQDPFVQLPPGRWFNVDVNGYALADDPEGTMPVGTVLLDRFYMTFYSSGEEIGSGTETASVLIVAPELASYISKSMRYYSNAKYAFITAYNRSPLPQSMMVTDLLPLGLEATSVSITECPFSNCASSFQIEILPNYQGTGRDLVRVSTLPGVLMPAGSSRISVNINFVVPGEPPGTYVNTSQVFLDGDTDICQPLNSFQNPTPPATDDPLDLDGDGNTAESYCQGSASFTIAPTAPFLVSQKKVKGDLDSEFQGFPSVGLVSGQGGTGEYELTLTNRGLGALTNLVLYDILPYVGDTGVSDSQLATPRLTAFPVGLTGLLTGVPVGATVEYSDSTNPCRTEVAPSQDSSCVNDWTTTPDDINDVKALKVTLPSLAVGATATMIVPVQVTPADVTYAAGDIAWNSFAVKADDLLATEPPKVGLTVPQSDISVAKTVNDGESVTVAVGEEFTFEITVRHDTTIVENNDGSVSYVDRETNQPTGAVSPATNVVLADIVPAGMTIVSAMPAGAYDMTSNTWTVGDIYPDQEFTLRLVATLDGSRSVTNVAHVTNNNTEDKDSQPNNWTGTPAEDDEDTAEVEAVEPGVVLHKLVEDERDSDNYIEADASDGRTGDYIVGQPIRYRFVVENLSVLPLTEVVVTDPLIAGFCDAADLQVVNLPGSGSVTFNCEWPLGFSDTSAPIVNTATVTANYGDTELTDDDTAQVAVSLPDGSIGDLVWNDLNADGIIDVGEPGIGGVTVNLLAPNGTVLATTTTLSVPADLDGDGIDEPIGSYLFTGLSSGSYTVQVVGGAGSPLATMEQTYDEDDGVNSSPSTPYETDVLLGVDEEHRTADFGYVQPPMDFGDLPDSYNTTIANNGAYHVVGNLHLGAEVDEEDDGQPNSDATGDGSDEDGLERDLSDHWQPGSTVNIDAVVNGGTGLLAGWFDWNGDGDFDDANEFVDFGNVAGSQSLAITIPDSGYTTGSPVAARFRLFDPNDLPGNSLDANDYQGGANDGEVEDYMWEFRPTAVTLYGIQAGTNSSLLIASVVGFMMLALISIGIFHFRLVRIKSKP